LTELRVLNLGAWQLRHDATFEQFLRAPFLDRLTHLVVGCDLTDDRLRLLAACRRFGRLRSLTVAAPAATDTGLRAFLTTPHYGGLTHLSLSVASMPASVLDLLREPPHMPHLATLEIRERRAGLAPPDAVEALLRSPRYAYVRGFAGRATEAIWRERFSHWPFFQRERLEYS
jgi:hypothetical protein